MKSATQFHPGQRWISESEPELGLGSVIRVSQRTVTIAFPASGEKREYARDNAPLRRVRFRVGDTVKRKDGAIFLVQTVAEREGIIFYGHEKKELCETDLSDAISFNKPEERLLAGQVDSPDVFDLRFAALQHQHRRRQSKVRGFVGGRIDLIPHQLYISSEVSGRLLPRVLLADEVGLGKTIEACLILHRLILTGRAQRVLILVPESLVHQWFVELLRRFNLWFHIFDEERCDAIESANPEANPFLDDQFVLCSIKLFTAREQRVQQAIAAGWDMLVVDEAHHLGWSPDPGGTRSASPQLTGVSPEYAVVESLSGHTPGLLLLTATPEQLGMASHFARLRLLDPNRFHDLGEFINEAERYRDVARIAERLLKNEKLSLPEVKSLARILSQDEASVRLKLEQIAKAGRSVLPRPARHEWGEGRGEGLFIKRSSSPRPSPPSDGREGENVRNELINALLDQHGTGRVMFRNTRATIAGFPKRIVRLDSIEAPSDNESLFAALAEEFSADIDAKAPDVFEPKFSSDPRLDWLADWLRLHENEKVLLICRTQRKVEAIDFALRQRINVKMAVFHEGLSLVQRDRNAAWFAEEDGARMLICSEIGSEGRNFQFAHHLVLFDLPLDPELVEQRIGRLDRIGQTSEIQVHVPFVAKSSQEVLVRWYHEGLNAFEKNLHGGRELLEQFDARLRDLAQDYHETEKTARVEVDRLIEETKTARGNLATRLEQGRDRLLELNSFRAPVAAQLIAAIQNQDKDQSLDDFMLSVFDHYSIHIEELAPRTYRLGSAGVFADSFPGLPAEGMTITCDRTRALSREDVQFLTWDHPLVTGALDLLLGSEKGNSSFAKWIDSKNPGLYVEAVYLLECVAPPNLHVDRFLPPTPLRVLVDHRGNDAGAAITPEILTHHLKKAEPYTLLDSAEVREELLPVLLEKAESIAQNRVPALVAQARQEMNAQLGYEIVRLRELQKVNRSVRVEEIEMLTRQQNDLQRHLSEARLRLDAIRLIQRGPV